MVVVLHGGHGGANVGHASTIRPARALVDIWLSSGAGHADCSGTSLSASEGERGDDVGEPKGEGDDTRADDHLRNLGGHTVIRIDAAVETTEEMAADEDHDGTEPGEALAGPKHRPGFLDDILALLPGTDLGEDEKAGEEKDEGMDDIGEELETVGQLGEDEHEHRCYHDGQ